MSGGVPVPGGLKRYTNLLAGQPKNNVSITGGAISGVSITGATMSGTINTNIVATTSNTSVTSNTTLADVSELLLPVEIGTYKVRVACLGSSAASGGWKIAFRLSATAVITSWNLIPTTFSSSSSSTGSIVTTTASQTPIVNTSAALTRAVVEGVMVIGTAGSMVLQFAQNTSNATASVLNAGSTIEFTRIA